MKILYFSPHLDDVAFSIGVTCTLLGGGGLVNIFSRSAGARRLLADRPSSLAGLIDVVSEERRSEDHRWAQRAGCVAYYLDLGDTSATGDDFRDRNVARRKMWEASPRINQFLMQQSALVDNVKAIFCPLGVGGHVEHLAIFDALRNSSVEVPAKLVCLFYEELPYASRPGALRNRFAELAGWLHDYERWIVPMQGRIHEKLRLISIYRSQFNQDPTDLVRFTPAVDKELGVHEAFWAPQELPGEVRGLLCRAGARPEFAVGGEPVAESPA